MIRRLHLEEVQPPVPTVAAASELNKSGDEDERRSLALEFKQLLSKVVGQVDPGSDEGTALAMALAQAMPGQRVSQQDLQRAQDTDRTQENADHDILDDDANDREQLAVVVDEGEREDGCSQGSKSVEHDGENSRDSAQNGAAQGVSNITAQLETVTDLTGIGQDVVENDEDTVGPQVCDFDSDGVAQFVASDSWTQEVAITATDLTAASEEVAARIDVRLAQQQDSRVQVQDALSEEGSEDLTFETIATQVGSGGLGETEMARRVVSAQKSPTNTDFAGSFNQPVEGYAQSQGSAQISNLCYENNSSIEDANPSEGVIRKRVEDASQGQQASKDLMSSEPEVVSPPVSQTIRRSSEGVVQMTILRQAFESLRAARQESPEGQQKPSAPTIAGTAATTAPKRSEDTSSSKGSRMMSKGHLARMLERVQSTLTEAAKARDGKTISLRLDPANLGRVKVDVSLKDGSLHARITPENQQVMTALREHAHELQGALRKLGLDVDTVTVTVRSDGFHEEATRGQNSFDGSTFQQDRNNMPHERPQVAENTFGNELAQWKEAVAPEQGVAVVDHWVA